MPQWRDPLPDAATTTFWGSLRPPDREALAAAGTLSRFTAGEPLCHEHLYSGRVFLIQHGVVEVFRDDPAGHRIVLARRGPGDVIGELAAVDRRPTSASVVAVEPTVALVVPAGRFAAVCQERPGVAWQVLTIAVARLRDSDTHRSRSRADVRHRTIMVQLELAGAGAEAAVGASAAATGPVTVALGQQSLADMASASLVSVTRVLEELRDRGAVTTRRGRMTVDPELLRDALDRPV